MRYILRRCFPARYRTAGRGKKRRKLLVLVVSVLLLWGILSETGLSSVTQELTETVTRGYLLSAIQQAVKEELQVEERDFVAVNRTGSGEISAVSADVTALNDLKAGILLRLSKSLNGKATAHIPIGSLTNIGIFNGRGPKVPVKLKLEGTADIVFRTEFSSAGINQSCHRITMTVTATAYSQSNRFEARVTDKTETVLAETVLVGEVPDAALTRTY
ncbi:MAG: sporulation protein YunB [Acutalibacter sp.]|nr:sporulation protein YunB [Acutalibacter sp.]